MRRDWLLLEGRVVRATPGYEFQITEVKKPDKPMTDAELREVGKPGWSAAMREASTL